MIYINGVEHHNPDTPEEIRDALLGLADDERQIIISRPTTGQRKIYAIQTHSDGKQEIEQSPIEILRPNAAGDECLISGEIGATCPNHYQNVDEDPHDGDVSCVSSDADSLEEDLYNLPPHSEGSGAINYVKVYIVCKATGAPSQPSAYVHIKTNGGECNGIFETLTTGYATYSYQWDKNPPTSAAWTWDEIDALQIGVGCRKPAAGETTRCTQVYVEIGYVGSGIEKIYPGHPDLTGGGETSLHSHAGGGGLSKHMDSGTYTITLSKLWEAVPFNSTFPSVPMVVVCLQDVEGGKKSGQKDATTTGFDITGEALGDCDWIAREEGYE
ncbi:hypothetical protein ES703_55913 [subsurface metagenome]